MENIAVRSSIHQQEIWGTWLIHAGFHTSLQARLFIFYSLFVPVIPVALFKALLFGKRKLQHSIVPLNFTWLIDLEHPWSSFALYIHWSYIFSSHVSTYTVAYCPSLCTRLTLTGCSASCIIFLHSLLSATWQCDCVDVEFRSMLL